MCALSDIVATKLILLLLVRAECMRTNVMRAVVDVVATKLGIILLFSFCANGVRVHEYCACVQGWM